MSNVHPMRTSRSRTKPDHDPFALDDGLEYDPDKFYTGSRDHERESISIAANIPRSLNGHIEALVQSGKIPYYRTKQDFVRDAIHHRMYHTMGYLERHAHDPALERALATELAKAAVARRLQDLESMDETVRSYEDVLERSLRAEHEFAFTETLAEAENTLGVWPDCSAKQALAAVVDRYRKMSNGHSQ